MLDRALTYRELQVARAQQAPIDYSVRAFCDQSIAKVQVIWTDVWLKIPCDQRQAQHCL